MSFIFVTGFNIEDLINVPPLKEGKPVEIARSTNENNNNKKKLSNKAGILSYPAVR